MLSMKNAVMEAYAHGGDPRFLLCELLQKDSSEASSFSGVDPSELWNLAFQLAISADAERLGSSKEPLTSLPDVYHLIDSASRIVVLMGAGASTGPDFRSKGGLYDSIRQAHVLDDPCDVFDLDCFRQDPSIFWKFAHLIFPTEIPVHSAAHRFVEGLEQRGKLLRLYTQNVDTLERGIPDSKLRCVHGSWRENHCMGCGQAYGIDDLRPAVAAGTVPQCVNCGGFIKPGIVFFGQPTNLNEREVYEDAALADLLIVIGTSLRVQPVSELPNVMRQVPSILINREPVGCEFNAELIGDCTDVVEGIEAALGWREAAECDVRLYEPNKFVYQSESDRNGTCVVETGRNKFLVTPVRADLQDFD